MALQAERHAERLGVIHLVHLIDPAVALDAADPAIDVNGVIEIDEVGQLVDLDPGNRPPALGAVANQFQARIILDTWLWQFMQVELAGMFENQDFSTPVWQ